jgi:hypothetical protein
MRVIRLFETLLKCDRYDFTGLDTCYSILMQQTETYKEFLPWADENTSAEQVALPQEDVGKVVMTDPASRHIRRWGFS